MRPEPQNPLALAVRSIVNRHDPMGLMALHCPADEYDPELPGVLEAMRDATGMEDLRDRVKQVFRDYFDLESVQNFEAWEELARELWDLARGGDGRSFRAPA